MEHFDQGPFALGRLAGNQHQVAWIDGVMRDPMDRGCAERAHDLRGNAQNRTDRHGSVRVDPFFGQGSFEIFRDVNQVIVLDSEIIEGGNVGMAQLLRRHRFGFEPSPAPAGFQGGGGNHFHHHFLPGIDLLRLVSQGAVGEFSDRVRFPPRRRGICLERSCCPCVEAEPKQTRTIRSNRAGAAGVGFR